jgi:sucrose phosphorylase
VNCTYYDALARNDAQYLIARAIQFFVPGIPQVYYMGFLAGENDMELLARTKVGRDINRHYFSREEIVDQLEKPVIKKLTEIIRLRNTHPAFHGDFDLLNTADNLLIIKWQKDNLKIQLSVDLALMKAEIKFTQSDSEKMIFIS